MTKTTKYLVYGGAALGGLALWYINAAKDLKIDITDPNTGLPNIQFKNADNAGLHLNLRFAVTNTSILPFLAPKFSMNIVASDGNQIGTAISDTVQAIASNSISFVDVTATIPYVALASNVLDLIQTAITNNTQLPTGINYTGYINLWFYSVPIQGQIT